MPWHDADVEFHALHAGHIHGSDPERSALFVRIHHAPDLDHTVYNNYAHPGGRRPVARSNFFQDLLSDRLVFDGSSGDGKITLRRKAAQEIGTADEADVLAVT